MIPLRDDNPSTIKPVVTITFVALCALVFLWQFSLVPGARPAKSCLRTRRDSRGSPRHDPAAGHRARAPVGHVFTSMFMHGGFMHLLGNMLYLWIFGDNVEDSMGHVRFVIFYLLCGVAAVFAQALPDPNSQMPMVGASGAISGVLGAYHAAFSARPRARPDSARLRPAQTRVPAGDRCCVLWFGLQLFSDLLSGPQGSGVAFRAHIGGFIAGMALIALFKKRQSPPSSPVALRRIVAGSSSSYRPAAGFGSIATIAA